VSALRHPLLDACGVRHGFGVRGVLEPEGVVRPRQVHGRAVARVAPGGIAAPAEADAIVAVLGEPPVAVVTADCVPVLAAARDGSAVAAIHAGWRGLAQGVIEAGVRALRACAGAQPLVAAIGPRIGPCCYEVDAPVLDALGARFGADLDPALRPSRPGHRRLDLGLLALRELDRLGLGSGAAAALSGVCTACEPERFHSYRRDGTRAGRLVHFVAPRARA
jgi:YfiH family protein